jgi:hypothetical protein
MENEQLLSAITQLMEDQKQINAQNEKISIELQKINQRMSTFGSSLNTAEANALDAGMDKLQKDVALIKNQLSEMPKGIIQQKRYLFFPEYNAKEYYAVVLRWLLYMLVATYACYLLRLLIGNLE